MLEWAFSYTVVLMSSISCSIGPETCDILDRLLILDPRTRITASQALEHDYFWSDPLPADPKTYVEF